MLRIPEDSRAPRRMNGFTETAMRNDFGPLRRTSRIAGMDSLLTRQHIPTSIPLWHLTPPRFQW